MQTYSILIPSICSADSTSMILIDVGSYYARGGEEKRGKGLSMTEEQYAGLKAEADNIRTVLDDCL